MFVFREDGFNEQQRLQLESCLKQLQKELSPFLLKYRNRVHCVYSKAGYKLFGMEGYFAPLDLMIHLIFYF